MQSYSLQTKFHQVDHTKVEEQIHPQLERNHAGSVESRNPDQDGSIRRLSHLKGEKHARRALDSESSLNDIFNNRKMTPGSHILIHYLTRKWHEYSDEAIQSAEGPSQQYHAILHILSLAANSCTRMRMELGKKGKALEEEAAKRRRVEELMKELMQIFNEDDDEGDQLEGNQVERKQNFLSLVDSVSEAIADVALSRNTDAVFMSNVSGPSLSSKISKSSKSNDGSSNPSFGDYMGSILLWGNGRGGRSKALAQTVNATSSLESVETTNESQALPQRPGVFGTLGISTLNPTSPNAKGHSKARPRKPRNQTRKRNFCLHTAGPRSQPHLIRQNLLHSVQAHHAYHAHRSYGHLSIQITFISSPTRSHQLLWLLLRLK
uniref:Uncharacterized protein n=1 Tax=Moniliophthora roreri TaxID=221103 RepID=A0A0W0FG46_MONRR